MVSGGLEGYLVQMQAVKVPGYQELAAARLLVTQSCLDLAERLAQMMETSSSVVQISAGFGQLALRRVSGRLALTCSGMGY
jgi:hypothetical protein